MSVKDYSKEPRSDGYTGIRVARTVNGKLIQRYFARGKMEEALACDAALRQRYEHLKDGISSQYRQRPKYTADRYDPPRRTKVTGLTISFQEQKRCNPIRYYAGIIIAHQNKAEDKFHITSRAITLKRDLETTWQVSCEILATWRGYDHVPKAWLDCCPDPDDFETLREFYCEHGEEIDEGAMNVFLGLPYFL